MALTAITTGIADPVLLKALRRIQDDLEQRTPLAGYSYIDVQFNSIADNDTIIVHPLEPNSPSDIDYEIVAWRFASAPAAAPVVYTDISASRRAWANGYIVLRCNVASVQATLRLSVRNA